MIEPDARTGAVVSGNENDAFSYLGMHERPDGSLVVRAFIPKATGIAVIDADGNVVANLARLHLEGFFAGPVPKRVVYRLRIASGNERVDIEDPYRFGPVVGELDAYLIASGRHLDLYRVLGAHPRTIEGVPGVTFAVWAPNARRVSVVGDWNGWDGRVHVMRLRRECGVYEIFLPHVPVGSRYKFEIVGEGGTLLALKADPVAFAAEMRPNNASIVVDDSTYPWNDTAWMQARGERNSFRSPISVYEVHAGSWRRGDGDRFLTYRELAAELIPYVVEMGFTHIELLPITEHPFDGSWGYQTTGMFAPTSRFGSPDDFREFVDAAHAAGLGVLLDWVPGHFPVDAFSLGYFDGTHLYEHADPRKGFHEEWGTYAYALGRTEIDNFLIASALYWLREFHIDGLRVDAVSSIVYLDYSREAGAWIPNIYGGNENLEATAFLRRFNETVYREVEGILTVAEESTSWPNVSAPTSLGGLGFGFKWNMGWMHDTLAFFQRDPMHRGYHLNDISFGLVYAFTENYMLPLSHDEVVHGKGSLIDRMPGGEWEQFANLRLLFGLMFAHPGKKLIFMGGEFGQRAEWNAAHALDWYVLQYAPHAGVKKLVADCNALYRTLAPLHRRDKEPAGFEWITYEDRANAVVAFVRWDDRSASPVLAVFNTSGVRIDDYRLGVPRAGYWREILNTDASLYGGRNEGNAGGAHTEAIHAHGREQSVSLTLPALCALWFSL